MTFAEYVEGRDSNQIRIAIAKPEYSFTKQPGPMGMGLHGGITDMPTPTNLSIQSPRNTAPTKPPKPGVIVPKPVSHRAPAVPKPPTPSLIKP